MQLECKDIAKCLIKISQGLGSVKKVNFRDTVGSVSVAEYCKTIDA